MQSVRALDAGVFAVRCSEESVSRGGSVRGSDFAGVILAKIKAGVLPRFMVRRAGAKFRRISVLQSDANAFSPDERHA